MLASLCCTAPCLYIERIGNIHPHRRPSITNKQKDGSSQTTNTHPFHPGTRSLPWSLVLVQTQTTVGVSWPQGALDLSASGINMKKIEEIRTFYDYTVPLMEVMESLPPGEKVVLVGHSLGGLNLALAMDKFPQKISTAVFLTAYMPDTVHKPSFVIEQSLKGTTPESWLDTKFESYGTPEMPLTSMLFGPKFLASKLYQLCPIQDFTLATILVRPGSLFLEDLAHANSFSNEGYGSVTRVFVVCNEDYAIPEEFQRWMIENSGGVKEVKEIKGADHMAMFSKPRELCCCLLEIANKHT